MQCLNPYAKYTHVGIQRLWLAPRDSFRFQFVTVSSFMMLQNDKRSTPPPVIVLYAMEHASIVCVVALNKVQYDVVCLIRNFLICLDNVLPV